MFLIIVIVCCTLRYLTFYFIWASLSVTFYADGSLYTATPIDPVFIMLPIFEEARMKVRSLLVSLDRGCLPSYFDKTSH